MCARMEGLSHLPGQWGVLVSDTTVTSAGERACRDLTWGTFEGCNWNVQQFSRPSVNWCHLGSTSLSIGQLLCATEPLGGMCNTAPRGPLQARRWWHKTHKNRQQIQMVANNALTPTHYPHQSDNKHITMTDCRNHFRIPFKLELCSFPAVSQYLLWEAKHWLTEPAAVGCHNGINNAHTLRQGHLHSVIFH